MLAEQEFDSAIGWAMESVENGDFFIKCGFRLTVMYVCYTRCPVPLARLIVSTTSHHYDRIVLSLLSDQRGSILSAELVFAVVVAVAGLITVFAATRDAMTSELSDTVGAVQEFNQSFNYFGLRTNSNSTEGASYADHLDVSDSIGDPSDSADNCIVFDVPPSDEIFPVSTESLVADFGFEGDVQDQSGAGNNGSLQGDAQIVDGVLELDGNGDFVAIANSSDLNLGTFQERTIALQFTAEDVNRRQVLFEEGGTVRGLNIYIENGQLYVGGWNIPETGWNPTFISTSIQAGQEISVALVLNGTNSVQSGALSGFVNGQSFGTAVGSQIHQHSGGIGLGGVNRHTVFEDGTFRGNTGFNFGGQIDNFSIYNRALSGSEINALSHQ